MFARKDYCRCGCARTTSISSALLVNTSSPQVLADDSGGGIAEALKEEMEIISKTQKSLLVYEMALAWAPLGVDWMN